VLLVGVLAQSGGIFWHLLAGKQGCLSIGNGVTMVSALLLAFAALLLAYGLIAAHTRSDFFRQVQRLDGQI
jgi:hypothetical protein